MRFDDGTHISIHEASLINYSSMQIVGTGSKKLHCDLAPWSNGDKVRTVVPFKTPWRTIKITNNAKDLISSNITLNSNPPNKLGDVSWVKPSKYIGIWWGMIIGKWTWEESFRHGATIERSKKYIDFASENGFDEVLVEGTSRVEINKVENNDKLTCTYTNIDSDNYINNNQYDALFRTLEDTFSNYVKLNKKVPPEVISVSYTHLTLPTKA